MASPLEVFCCYAREDQEMLKQLKKHLAPLERRGQIKLWSDTDLNAGVEWEQELHMHLERADLILLLISPDFMNSDYCYSIEMRRAIERHEQGSARVVPIILRATFWRDAPFARLQILPKDARPVKSWPDLDEALSDVTERLSQTIAALRSCRAPAPAQSPVQPTQPRPVAPGRTKEEWMTVGNDHFDAGRFTEALAAYEQALGLDPTNALAHINKGVALRRLGRGDEALAAYEQALELDPTDALAYYNKGVALRNLKRHAEALAAYEQALRFAPTFALAYHDKGDVLTKLGRHAEAQRAYDRARELGYRA
ncbi:MAG TPA: tetratricopeptide repeat protein [Ktedonobacteraceae bacterium]